MSSFQPQFIDTVPEQAARWRRVVTGERDGKSVIAIDEAECPFQMGVAGAQGVAVTDLWKTFANPACDPTGPDSCSMPLSFGPPPGGTVVQMLEWPPDRELFGVADPAIAKAAINHRTASIDVVHIISGEIYAMLDEEEVCLKAGDTLVQRGTSHAWSNRRDEPCRMLAVMVSTTDMSEPN